MENQNINESIKSVIESEYEAKPKLKSKKRKYNDVYSIMRCNVDVNMDINLHYNIILNNIKDFLNLLINETNVTLSHDNLHEEIQFLDAINKILLVSGVFVKKCKKYKLERMAEIMGTFKKHWNYNITKDEEAMEKKCKIENFENNEILENEFQTYKQTAYRSYEYSRITKFFADIIESKNEHIKNMDESHKVLTQTNNDLRTENTYLKLKINTMEMQQKTMDMEFNHNIS